MLGTKAIAYVIVINTTTSCGSHDVSPIMGIFLWGICLLQKKYFTILFCCAKLRHEGKTLLVRQIFPGGQGGDGGEDIFAFISIFRRLLFYEWCIECINKG